MAPALPCRCMYRLVRVTRNFFQISQVFLVLALYYDTIPHGAGEDGNELSMSERLDERTEERYI